MARYQAEPGTEIGGVDASGEVHDPIVFDEAGFCEVPEDMQEFAQSLAHATRSGLVHLVEVPAKPKRSV